MPKNKSTTRDRTQSPNARPSPIHVQHIADTAATRALDAFANSQDRKDELRAIMKEAVQQTLDKLGINLEKADEFRADMVHLRTWREFTELVKTNGIGAATSWLTKGLLIVISLGIVALTGKHLSGN